MNGLYRKCDGIAPVVRPLKTLLRIKQWQLVVSTLLNSLDCFATGSNTPHPKQHPSRSERGIDRIC